MKIASLCLLGIVSLAAQSSLQAQDVTVAEPIWFLPDPAPEVLPKPRSKLRPDFPSEMKATREPGYVVIVRFVDADGKSLSLNASGSHVPFQRAVEAEFRDWNMTGGKQAGKNVGGRIWMAAIFNPKSASPKGPDATPRLLEVAPVLTTSRVAPEGSPPLVPMHLKLDATGALLEATPVGEIKPRVLEEIRTALQKWRFAPARQAGQPIASELTLPVICQPLPKPSAGNYVPPRVTKQSSPEYPPAMRASRMRGEVTIRFEVDVEGEVKNPVVLRSNNPGFNESALAALQKWKFKPATRDDKPVKATMTVPVTFDIHGIAAADAYEVSNNRSTKRLPEGLQYDVPPKIRGTVVPVYPYSLLQEKLSGSAKVIIGIDEQGRVVQTRVLEATRPEFGLALVAAVEAFTFDPAMKEAKPVPSALRHEQEFDFSKLVEPGTEQALGLEKKHPERIANAGKLDTPLHPISRLSPIFPRSLLGKVDSGSASVEILVDEKGHVRAPRVNATSDEAFGYAAVQAVSSWLFDPPKQAGKTVVTRIVVPFVFSMKDDKNPGKAAIAPGK